MSQLTEKAIIQSFLGLLKEKPFDKITVKDIVEDCGINRNTFYYHYADIYDLLRRVFELRAREVLDLDVIKDNWPEQFLRSTVYVFENRKTVYHIYNSIDRQQLEQFLYQVAGEIMTAYVREKAKGLEADEDDILIIVDFYKCALVGMVIQWLDGGMKQEPEVVIRRIADLQDGNILRMLKRAEAKKE
ncbi:MAG: TetR-like C-terminal domain-containing protein [Eubacteriales bacterium]|nr:TetR-like C-terminal domain-containing protein [Eubacteriales bacterium]